MIEYINKRTFRHNLTFLVSMARHFYVGSGEATESYQRSYKKNIDFIPVIIELIYEKVRNTLESKKDGRGNSDHGIIAPNAQ